MEDSSKYLRSNGTGRPDVLEELLRGQAAMVPPFPDVLDAWREKDIAEKTHMREQGRADALRRLPACLVTVQKQCNALRLEPADKEQDLVDRM
jgi:hypothetical protein